MPDPNHVQVYEDTPWTRTHNQNHAHPDPNGRGPTEGVALEPGRLLPHIQRDVADDAAWWGSAPNKS